MLSAPCQKAAYTRVRGIVLIFWKLHHFNRVSSPEFTQMPQQQLSKRETSISKLFGHATYKSPSDSVNVTVTDLPHHTDPQQADGSDSDDGYSTKRKKEISPQMDEAAKRRREALQERKNRMGEAWQNGTKPVLKPGDIVSMLRPTFETAGHRQDLSSFPNTVPCDRKAYNH